MKQKRVEKSTVKAQNEKVKQVKQRKFIERGELEAFLDAKRTIVRFQNRQEIKLRGVKEVGLRAGKFPMIHTLDALPYCRYATAGNQAQWLNVAEGLQGVSPR